MTIDHMVSKETKQILWENGRKDIKRRSKIPSTDQILGNLGISFKDGSSGSVIYHNGVGSIMTFSSEQAILQILSKSGDVKQMVPMRQKAKEV
ncbi:unnamed protein product [Pieris macdunnoughi]|uniref:Uncharacterized protein n=1 Tax=Pieris macdunnoughi TaxID=345717 RepID=A0A821QV63_9NEOP|nr:unnamed protein product [Pieris macdunnoughi]